MSGTGGSRRRPTDAFAGAAARGVTCQIIYVESCPTGAVVDLIVLDPIDTAGGQRHTGVPFTLRVGSADGLAWTACLELLVEWAQGSGLVHFVTGGSPAPWFELSTGETHLVFGAPAR